MVKPSDCDRPSQTGITWIYCTEGEVGFITSKGECKTLRSKVSVEFFMPNIVEDFLLPYGLNLPGFAISVTYY